MKFLADQNFPRPAVRALRAAGFEIAWIGEDRPGASDDEILERCTAERLTLLTLDKDFGQMVFQRGLPAESGVILFRVDTESPEQFGRVDVDVLKSREDWTSHFTVVTPERIRMTPLRRS